MSGEEIKEVQMDVPQEGGGGKTRRRQRARRTKKQRSGDEESTHAVTVEKTVSASETVIPPPLPQIIKAPVVKQLNPNPTPKPIAGPVVVLSPAKKKAKVMLVSKKATALSVIGPVVPPKTFKAKRIRVTIDNTARTQKRRRQVLRSVDSLSEEQLREQAVKFGLSRTDSVKKAPIDLLRKMLKDYYAMRKGFI
jgi:hypothetical protein